MKTSIPFILLVGIASLGLQASGKSSTLEEATVGAFAPQNRDDEDRFILPGPADSARDYERNVVWLNGSRQRVQWYVAKMEREHIDYRLLLWAMAGRRRKWTEMYNTYGIETIKIKKTKRLLTGLHVNLQKNQKNGFSSGLSKVSKISSRLCIVFRYLRRTASKTTSSRLTSISRTILLRCSL